MKKSGRCFKPSATKRLITTKQSAENSACPRRDVNPGIKFCNGNKRLPGAPPDRTWEGERARERSNQNHATCCLNIFLFFKNKFSQDLRSGFMNYSKKNISSGHAL